MFIQLIVSGLITGCVYAMVALGMTVLYRSTSIVNWCQGALFMLGAFAVVVPLESLGFSYAEAISFSVVFLFVIGIAIEGVLMRPLQNAPHISVAMVTIALAFLFTGIAQFFFGREFKPLRPLLQGPPVQIGSVVVLPQGLVIVGVFVAIVLAFVLFFQKTEIGKVIQAASQTPRGAFLVGINVPVLRNVMWGVGAALGAVAGILIAPTTLVYPDMGAHMLLEAFAAMTLGGFGSLTGAAIGGLCLGVLENLVGGYVSTSLVTITSYLAIIVVLLVRPQGVMGQWRQGRG